MAVVCLVVLLVATACVANLGDDEGAWCADHPEDVVWASYVVGSPMSLSDVRQEAEAASPSEAYVRACKAAYRDR